MEEEQEQNIVHSFDESKPRNNLLTPAVLAVFVILVLLGSVTGYLLASIKRSSGDKYRATPSSGSVKKGSVFGLADTATFRDQAEGVLREGGINGEGAYHLERPGGPSQNVYLTSSVIDLSKFVNKKVKVWGETNKAKKAGWLMDVGKLEVLE